MNKGQLRLVVNTVQVAGENKYNAYNLEKLINTTYGKSWVLATSYDSLEEALRWNEGIIIIDKTK